MEAILKVIHDEAEHALNTGVDEQLEVLKINMQEILRLCKNELEENNKPKYKCPNGCGGSVWMLKPVEGEFELMCSVCMDGSGPIKEGSSKEEWMMRIEK